MNSHNGVAGFPMGFSHFAFFCAVTRPQNRNWNELEDEDEDAPFSKKQKAFWNMDCDLSPHVTTPTNSNNINNNGNKQ